MFQFRCRRLPKRTWRRRIMWPSRHWLKGIFKRDRSYPYFRQFTSSQRISPAMRSRDFLSIGSVGSLDIYFSWIWFWKYRFFFLIKILQTRIKRKERIRSPSIFGNSPMKPPSWRGTRTSSPLSDGLSSHPLLFRSRSYSLQTFLFTIFLCSLSLCLTAVCRVSSNFALSLSVMTCTFTSLKRQSDPTTQSTLSSSHVPTPYSSYTLSLP